MSQIIPQTSKAILFEEFNPNMDKPSLLKILSTTKQENISSSEVISKIEKELGVRSFKEFLEKFAPEIWEYVANGKFHYTTDAVEAQQYNGVPKNITSNTYYEMLVNMYDQKGSSNQANEEFDYDSLFEMLSPQREAKEAKQLRANLEAVTKEAIKKDANGENISEEAEAIRDYRREIISKYKSGSIVSLLPLLIEDAKIKINKLEEMEQQDALPAGEGTSRGNSMRLQKAAFDVDGNIQFLDVKHDETKNLPAAQEEKAPEAIRKMITADFDRNYASSDENGGYVKSLMLDIYTPPQNKALDNHMNLPELKERKAELEGYYSQAKQDFINKVSEIIQKVIGVKVFFDHATAQNGDDAKLEQTLIVANCKPADLVENAMKPKFEEYIKNVGLSQVSNKCWFAILPDVKYSGVDRKDSNAKQQSGGLEDMFDEAVTLDDDGKATKSRTGDALTLPVAKTMLDVLDKGHIVTVFNFEAFKENTFARITDESIRNIKEKLKKFAIKQNHAVYAYPDFTLVEERRISVTDNVDRSNSVTVPAIHIDAAYPAAGLLIASQQMETLKARGMGKYLITDEENMNPIRIDLENGLPRKYLTTKFNRENLMNWSKSVVDEIEKDMFGMGFCSNELIEEMNHTYIRTCRTMGMMEGQKYKPVYRVLMEDFLFAIADGKCEKKRSEIDKVLIGSLVPQWVKLANRNGKETKVNQVLLKGENISWSEDNPNKLVIKFLGGDAPLDSIDVVSNDIRNE